MNVLQIKIHEDGTLECSPDFKIIRGGYRNILLNVEVPHSLLLAPVMEEASNQDVTGNFVRVAGIIRTVTGKNLQTQKYELEQVKDYGRDGKMYRLYQRIMPKEFTLWETVSQSEALGKGLLQLIFNVINWTKSDSNSVMDDIKVEQIIASPVLSLDVYAGAFLEDIEAIENPIDYEIIKERVDNVEIGLDKANNDIKALQDKDQEIEAEIKTLQDKDEEIITNTSNQIQAVQDKAEEDINQLRTEVNEKPYFFGWFNSYADLIANYPTATENDYAYVIGGNIYEYHNNQWVDTGNKTPENIAPLSDDEPLPVGPVASAGTSNKAAKGDHVHKESEQTLKNTENIAQNTEDIETNKVNIAKNAQDISRNTEDIANKIDKSQIMQEVGDSELDVMSQKAVTDELFLKVNNAQIVQETGDSITNIMSQKAVTDLINDNVTLANSKWKRTAYQLGSGMTTINLTQRPDFGISFWALGTDGGSAFWIDKNGTNVIVQENTRGFFVMARNNFVQFVLILNNAIRTLSYNLTDSDTLTFRSRNLYGAMHVLDASV